MIELDRLGYKIVTQVHDSIVIQLKKTELQKAQQIVEIMENVYKLDVPVKVDWGFAKSFSKTSYYNPEDDGILDCRMVKDDKGDIHYEFT